MWRNYSLFGVLDNITESLYAINNAIGTTFLDVN